MPHQATPCHLQAVQKHLQLASQVLLHSAGAHMLLECSRALFALSLSPSWRPPHTYFVFVCRPADCSAGAAPPKARAPGGAAGPAGAGARAAGRPGERFTPGVQCADEPAAVGRRRRSSGGKGRPSSQAAAPSSAGNVGLPWCRESGTVCEDWDCLHTNYCTILSFLRRHVVAILLHPAHHLTGARWRRTSFQRSRGSWRRSGRPPA